MRTIYFDYNATTPLDAGVRGAMLPFLDEIYGNPSSVHHVGRQARALLDDARDRVAKVWRCRRAKSFLRAAEQRAITWLFSARRGNCGTKGGT